MIRLAHWVRLLAVASAIATVGCGGTGDEDVGGDSGTGFRTDSGVRLDAGIPLDSGIAHDAGNPLTDSGWTLPTDSGTGIVDAGPTIPTQPGAVGAACGADTECTQPAGSTCQMSLGSPPISIAFPGGYCTHECTAGSGADVCGEGATCFSLGIGPALCAKTCSSNADCRQAEGYTCQASPIPGGSGGMYCLPPFGFPGVGGDGGFGLPGFGDGGFGLPGFGDGGFGLPGSGDGGFGLPGFGDGGFPGFP